MKTRSERERELRLMMESGGYRTGQVVAQFINAIQHRSIRTGCDAHQMVDVILNDEEIRGLISGDFPSGQYIANR